MQRLEGDIQEARLQELSLPVLDLTGLEKRDHAARKEDFSDPVFDAAKQFAAADAIVIAAPYRSEEHTSELQSRETISYAVFCLKKKTKSLENRFFFLCFFF